MHLLLWNIRLFKCAQDYLDSRRDLMTFSLELWGKKAVLFGKKQGIDYMRKKLYWNYYLATLVYLEDYECFIHRAVSNAFNGQI